MSNLAPASLLSILKTAATKLQYPKIIFQLPSGAEARFVLSKKYPDSVSVTRSREFIGYVRGNHLVLLRAVPKADAEAIEKLLDSEDLIESLGAHGREYVFCCFCGTQLENSGSRFHGYGPICAEKYRLPWSSFYEAPGANKQQPADISPEDI